MSEPGTGLLAWLEGVFFGVMELSFLSTPAFAVVALLQSRYPDAIPLSGLAAIGAGSVALAAFRGGRIDVGAWPPFSTREPAGQPTSGGNSNGADRSRSEPT